MSPTELGQGGQSECMTEGFFVVMGSIRPFGKYYQKVVRLASNSHWIKIEYKRRSDNKDERKPITEVGRVMSWRSQ